MSLEKPLNHDKRLPWILQTGEQVLVIFVILVIK